MSTQPVTADIGLGVVEGEIVESVPTADYGSGPSNVYLIDTGSGRFKVPESDVQ